MRASIVPVAVLCASLAAAPASAQSVFSVVVGVNRPLTTRVPLLRFADDDAIRFHQALSGLGHSTLLTEADEDSRQLYGALPEAQPPTRKNLEAALARVHAALAAARQRGEKPQLYFVYSGHGDAENNQGYLALSDGKLTSDDLAALLLEPSQAAVNHVVIDACRSFYLVRGKRAGGTRSKIGRPFHRSASLARRFPKTGFLLSTSSAANSHEWDAFQGGVFSHEVRSGMLGPADIDGNGQISYDEISSFVDVANGAIPSPLFRPRIWVKAPGGDGAAPLVDLRRSRLTTITVPATHAGRYYLEDVQGTRLADLHSAPSTSVTLGVPAGHERLYVHDVGRALEYRLERPVGAVSLASLTPHAASARPKGAGHDQFTRVFEHPFSRSAYLGALDARRRLGGTAPDASLAREGAVERADQRAGALSLTYELRSGYLDDAPLLHGVGAGYLTPVGPLHLGVRLAYAASDYQRGDGVEISLHELSAAALLLHRRPLWRALALRIGLDTGLSWAWQRGEVAPRETQTITQPLFRYSALLGADYRVTRRFWLIGSAFVGQAVLKKRSQIEGPWTAGMRLGLAFGL